MSKASEKRKAQRVPCLVPVDGKQNSTFGKSLTVDFSKTGMGFVSSVNIPLNKKVAIEIELDPSGESVVVVGRVKWVRSVNGSESYRYGVHFEELPPAIKSRLSKYLNK